MKLHRIPACHAPYQWGEIADALLPAIKRIPQEHDGWDLFRDILNGTLSLWINTEGPRGYVATSIAKQGPFRRVFWVIYAGGRVGSLRRMRQWADALESIATAERCAEMRFQGRDWRRALPDFDAKNVDGIWQFRKVLR